MRRLFRLLYKPWTLADAAVHVPVWQAVVVSAILQTFCISLFAAATTVESAVVGKESVSDYFKYLIGHFLSMLLVFGPLAFLFTALVGQWAASIQKHLRMRETINLVICWPISCSFIAFTWLALFIIEQADNYAWNEPTPLIWPNHPWLRAAVHPNQFWIAAMMSVLVAYFGFVRLAKYRIPSPTACTNCSYDLRGSIAAGSKHCPECGAAIRSIRMEEA